MQSRSHTNPYPDYISARNLYIKDGQCVDKELLDKIDSVTKPMIEQLQHELKRTTGNADYSMYTGYCGIAYLFFLIAVKNNDKEAMAESIKAVKLAINNLKSKRPGFLNGDAGPFCLAAMIHKLRNENDKAAHCAKRLVSLVDSLLYADIPDEALYGRCGYLFALVLANKHLGDDLVSPTVVRQVAEKMLKSGRDLAKCKKVKIPLVYEWHDKNYLGAAHGVAGILYTLLLAKTVLSDYELNELIQPTLDWLLKHRFPSGNFASSEGNDKDRLVQWCHGAPGFVHLLCLAAKVYGDNRYLDVALECGEVIWQRGLLAKGYSLCHGVAGNGYSFLHLYRETQDLKHLHRAACFAHWCTKYPKHQGMEPDRPLSLYEGVAGMVYFLFDFKEPNESAFPGYALN